RLVEVDVEDLRDRLRKGRKLRKMSQGEVGDLVGVSQATISAFEKGQYPSMRRSTLSAIRNLVQFWEKDAEGIVQGDFAHRRTLALPAQEYAAAADITECPLCRKGIPRHTPPFQFCPFCKATLGYACPCGAVVRDAEANFCSRCGRPVLQDDEEPHSYPLLEQDRLEIVRLVLRRTLLEGLDKSDSTQRLTALLSARAHPEQGAPADE
ncbi:MAG TPA: helix-turn-helix domain-containing protein, partial [Candidatus Hydrogenedentes bacterium]|nr:helix-turn-helix domain-containing protein [Candidatus Hydrogenedentota bacterium]